MKPFNRLFIISREERIIRFLSVFGNQVEIPFAELMKKAEKVNIPAGGSFSSTILDSRAMGLVSIVLNGSKRYELTALGKAILNNPTDRCSWKEAYLNVPLYKEYNSKFPDNKDYHNFIVWVDSNYKHRLLKRRQKFLNMGIRRFFEGFYNIKLPQRLRKVRTKTLSSFSHIITEGREETKQPTTFDDELFALIEVLKKAKERYSERDLKRLLEVL